jgi:hypothetical protein
MMNDYLRPTELLDFRHPAMKALTLERGWTALPEKEKIRAIYDFVRNEIAFGFNVADAIPASRVLKDGYGQCNTKSVLFMALLRAAGVPCRLHGFTVISELQKGALTGLWYRLRPKELVHTWVEIQYGGKWLNIEGFILDAAYLDALQRGNPECAGSFCGYGVAIGDFRNPPVEWTGGDTYIQKDGIRKDFGVYDDPDSFFAAHGQALGPLKRVLFRRLVRHAMNRNIRRMREGRTLS